MTMQIDSVFETSIMTLTGPVFDARAASAFLLEIASEAGTGGGWVLLDMKHVRRVDYTGVAAVLTLMQRLGFRGRLDLCGLSPKVLSKFEKAGVAPFFTRYDTREDALRDYARQEGWDGTGVRVAAPAKANVPAAVKHIRTG